MPWQRSFVFSTPIPKPATRRFTPGTTSPWPNKRGTYPVNTAHSRLVDREAVVRALESGQLTGYGSDAWFPQPASIAPPSRTMPCNGMTLRIFSDTSLSAQVRHAAGTLDILQSHFEGRPIREEHLSR